MSDANIEKIISAAKYAAMGPERETHEGGSPVYRYRRGPWLIAVTRMEPEPPLIDVFFDRKAVFRAVEGSKPEVYEPGEWETKLLENWGPHPDAL